MTKEEQTFKTLKEEARKVNYGELPVNLYIYEGEIVGFDEIYCDHYKRQIKFRAKGEKESS